MKKFYLLFAFLTTILGFTSSAGYGQNYTAVHSGAWHLGSNWDINGVPPSVCSGCNITIPSPFAMTLDVSIKLTGGSVLTIGTSGGSASGLLISQSVGATGFSTGHNILLDGPTNTNKVVLANINSHVDAIGGGLYDGIFSVFSDLLYTKLIGTPGRDFIGDDLQDSPNPLPALHTSVMNGPATLNSQGALPILLGNFDAVLDKKSVNLTWTTLLEINSDHYSIERSSDAANWKSIGIVAAIGNSSGKVNYSFVDVSPFSNINYYRLQMVDKDGKYKYSPVKVVRGSLINGYSIFPNPTHDNLNVTVSANAAEELTFRLINQSGQVMQERKFSHAAGTTVTLPVSNYPQGSYILTIAGSDGRREVSTVVITR